MPLDPLYPTIFHEPWWLDIVTGGDYAVAEVQENGAVVGRLPYFLQSRFGFRYSIMPPMTHFLGPAVLEGVGHHSTRFLRRAEIIRQLIHQLPPASLYRYKCHRDITDAIPFQQENFLVNVQFTYECPPTTEEELWKNLRGMKRRKIRHAQEELTLLKLTDPEEFWQFYDRNLKKRHIKNICDKTICSRLIETALGRDQGCVYAARDKNGQLVAAVFCVWDVTSVFYFMSTRTENDRNAVSLLTWEAMKDAAARGLLFDFDGLNNGSSVLFFTEFGGTISPRFIVTRQTLLGGVALAMKESSRQSRFFY